MQQAFKRDLLEGDLFLFVGKDRKRAKVLYFDGTGLCLFADRLAALFTDPTRILVPVDNPHDYLRQAVHAALDGVQIPLPYEIS